MTIKTNITKKDYTSGSNIYPTVPHAIMAMMMDYDAWMVGSGVLYCTGQKPDIPKDFDIIIAPHQWQRFMRGYREMFESLSMFGGVKLRDPATEMIIDVWPATLNDYYVLSVSDTKKPIWAMKWNPYIVVEAKYDIKTTIDGMDKLFED